MPSQVITSVENNFTKGLVTEFTGLNFPENAATDCDNVQFSLIGSVHRRLGIDLESPRTIRNLTTSGKAISTYVWNNAGGDGNTKLVCTQFGNNLAFYNASNVTLSGALSNQSLGSLDLSTFVGQNITFDVTKEFEYADGNGYLFLYHPSCDPIYITFVSNSLAANRITLKTRDFQGINDNQEVSFRAPFLSDIHLYNLQNQGWTTGSNWAATSVTTHAFTLGAKVFVVQAGLPVVLGEPVTLGSQYDFPYGTTGNYLSGTVTAYAGVNLTLNITSVAAAPPPGATGSQWGISPVNYGVINTWAAALGVVPSNADVWWYYKDNTGVFSPATTKDNVTINTGRAPQGHYILDEFVQAKTTVSSIAILNNTVIYTRPRTGTWFQGRVWYTGVDANWPATGNSIAYSYTENIYFSKTVSTTADFGICYQQNDPTSEQFFDLLPTDGGVIHIQGAGSIYKLFPIQNGLLVFAANGVWFITGSQGIGFAANDYTITKISSIRSVSSTSFVDVNGLPYFWNEEGIYAVMPSDKGGLTVTPLTVSSILSFYNEIPFQSKKYVRGSYDPIDYTVKWIYRDTNESSVTDRYYFNKILNYNTYNKAFYPFTVSTDNTRICGINYVVGSGGSTSPPPMIKYTVTFTSDTQTCFAEERDTNYEDWAANLSPSVFLSYFVTGYKLHGDAQRRFQMPYIYMYSDASSPTSYKIQGVWDYAITGDTGRWSTAQLAQINKTNYAVAFKKHKIRGQGVVLQIKVTSSPGEPFAIIGWSAFETQNMGI